MARQPVSDDDVEKLQHSSSQFRVGKVMFNRNIGSVPSDQDKQTNTSGSFFSFWHWTAPYASRDGNLKIACHTAHTVALGRGGGGKDCLRLNNSDTSHFH